MSADRIEVREVAPAPFGEELLAGIVDYPKSGTRLDGRSLEIVGWVVGRSAAVSHVELVEGDAPVARAAMREEREDIAREYLGSAQGRHVSFTVATPPLSPGEHELTLRALLEDGRGAVLATVRLSSVRRSRPAGLILLYHRIVELASEPWSMSVGPSRFEEQMQALTRNASPVALGDLVEGVTRGVVPARSVAVTFDDGYRDNFGTALPVLERHGVPATVFLATGFVGQWREMWWDQLDRILLEPGTLPTVLRVRLEGKLLEWDLGEDAVYSAARAEGLRRWRAGEAAPTRRHAAYRSLWNLLSAASPRARASAIEQLDEVCGVDSVARPSHRALTLEEVEMLGASDAIEVGAHSVTHSALSRLPRDAQRFEIEESKARLESLLDRPIVSFAYPFGTREHYTTETIDLLRESGLKSACANFSEAVDEDADLFQLPRTIVPDVDGDRFTELLRGWLDG
jgi:peptidoglycan/xylan/chitin deacetylase (PgdA/CDA1 family)